MFTSLVPLTEFYENLLPAARSAEYKLVLTAVAREADSPAFYEDVKRYWSSLHDATGPNILFLFAGANAATKLDKRGLRHPREPVVFRSNHLAFEGTHDKIWQMKWNDRFRSPDITSELRRGKPYLDESDDVTKSHTLEIYALSRFLGIREFQLPCLVFTLLRPQRFKNSIVPFSAFEQTTVYLYIKSIAETLEYHFESIDRNQDSLHQLEDQLRKIEKSTIRLVTARHSVRSTISRLDSNDAKDAALKILALTGAKERSARNRTEAYGLFKIVRSAYPGNYGIIPELQRLIDLSFGDAFRTYSFDTEDQVQGVERIRRQISSVEDGCLDAWSKLEERLELQSLNAQFRTTGEGWDYFIAYSSSDRSVAKHVFSIFSRVGRVFLDSVCLRPGDLWTRRIRSAQRNSMCTLLIVTENTPDSWYAESEYLYGIELMRSGPHTVVPVLIGQKARVPYGLEQIHAARVSDMSDLEILPNLVGRAGRDFSVEHENNNRV